MEKRDNKEKLISIDEVIIRAKILGIDLGKGNPRERLRYLTKIGLLPHAKKRSFNGNPPTGVYPEYVIGILKEIDEKIKAGKSIQGIKKEKERRELLSSYSYNKDSSFFNVNIEHLKTEKEKEKEKGQVKKSVSPFRLSVFYSKRLVNFSINFLIIIMFGLLFGFLLNNYGEGKIFTNGFSYFLATLNFFQKFQKIAQDSSDFNKNFSLENKGNYSFSNPEPYLTINTETDINAPLHVKEGVTTPFLNLNKGDFSASFVTTDLTANRVYTFPNTSGTVCLTTGNCFDPGSKISISIGNSYPNRLVKFISSNQLSNSSFEDFYNGIALTVDTLGRIGIGKKNPQYPLHVSGRIQATGDICTDLAGGRCLSTLILGSAPSFGGIISGAGTANYLPIWTGSSKLSNSVIYQSGSNIGIGTTTTSGATLTLSGNALFSTLSLPQLSLKYDDNNYLNFSISNDDSLVESSKNLILNSLTGEIRLGNNVNLVDAFGAKIQAATFISTTTDSTVRKSGELVLRASIPIFRFPIPAQSTSTDYVVVSKTFSLTDSLNSITLPKLPGADRFYSFLINFADDIPTSSSSSWRVYRPVSATTAFAFDFQGQNLASLETGNSFMTATTTLPDNDWRLEVKTFSTNERIKVFNIFLLALDEIN